MTMACARSQSPLAAHHRAASGSETPSGASARFTLRRNSSRVIARSPDATRLSASGPPTIGREPAGGLLDHVAERKQRLLVEGTADELKPEGQTLAVAAGRNSNAGQAGHVHRDG